MIDVGGDERIARIEFRAPGHSEPVAAKLDVLDGIAALGRLDVEAQRRRNADRLRPAEPWHRYLRATEIEVIVLALAAVLEVADLGADGATEDLVEADAQPL